MYRAHRISEIKFLLRVFLFISLASYWMNILISVVQSHFVLGLEHCMKVGNAALYFLKVIYVNSDIGFGKTLTAWLL